MKLPARYRTSVNESETITVAQRIDGPRPAGKAGIAGPARVTAVDNVTDNIERS